LNVALIYGAMAQSGCPESGTGLGWDAFVVVCFPASEV